MALVASSARWLRLGVVAMALTPSAAMGQRGLTVELGDVVPAEGRSVVEVRVSTTPKKPDGATISCSRAQVLASAGGRYGLLAPAQAGGFTDSCVATIGKTKKPFKVVFSPPPPGLYVDPPNRVFARGGVIVLDPFIIDDAANVIRPRGLRAAASSGELRVEEDGKLKIDLGSSKVPRVMALVFTDGQRRGAAIIPVIGKTELPVRVAAGSSVEVGVDGKWWGPVKARKGTTKVAIEVPPGVRKVTVRTRRGRRVVQSVSAIPVPSVRRLAAVADDASIRVAKSTRVVVAYVGSRGRAAGSRARLSAAADRGRVEKPRAIGAGLWEMRYWAPESAGADSLRVRVRGDRGAGSAVVALEITPGPVVPFSLSFTEDGPFAPGHLISGTARVRDAAGKRVSVGAIKATLGAATATLVRSGAGVRFEVRVPERIPANRQLSFDWIVAGKKQSVVVPLRSGPPKRASIEARAGRRGTLVIAAVVDEFGNPAALGDVAVRAVGATVHDRETLDHGRVRVRLLPVGARTMVDVEVVEGSRLLGRSTVALEAMAGVVDFGVWAVGGWVDNGGDVAGPRVGGGVGARHVLGPIELSLLLGAEWMTSSDTVSMMVAGQERDIDRSVKAVSFPIRVRGRVPLMSRFGVWLAGAFVPTRAQVKLSADFQSPDEYGDFAFGARGELGVDARLWRGRVTLGGSFGAANVADGPTVGSVERLSIVLGYEWWPIAW